jgi:hypothetical protein
MGERGGASIRLNKIDTVPRRDREPSPSSMSAPHFMYPQGLGFRGSGLKPKPNLDKPKPNLDPKPWTRNLEL